MSREDGGAYGKLTQELNIEILRVNVYKIHGMCL